MKNRWILHVDMDAFFAAVEVLDNPALQGKPVIVGGTPEGRGVVAAASYEARDFGVHSAMSAARAVKLCPQGVFLPGRHKRYGEVSRQVFSICRQFTDLVEPLSIDEAFLDVTGCERLFGPAVQIGHMLKQRIKSEIGLTASVGVAPNKFLAKLASDLKKPDGFFVFTSQNIGEVLPGLPISRLWGVGPATRKVLQEMGVEFIGDLLRVDRPDLVNRLGEHADHLLRLARGEDDRPVVTQHTAKSIGHEITFATDISSGDQLQIILDDLVAKVARRLRTQDKLARTVQIKARYPDFHTCTRATTLSEPTAATVVLRDAARELLSRDLQRRGRPLRLLGVSVMNLIRPEEGQKELFADSVREKEKKIDQVLDCLQGKFGAKSVKRGTRQKPD